MANVLDATAAALVADLSLGLTLGGNLFLGQMPNAPDLCLAIVEYGGGPPTMTFGGGNVVVERPRLQVSARGAANSYRSARGLLAPARAALIRAETGTYDGLRVLRWNPITSLMSLAADENDRPRIVFNIEVLHDEEAS
jgi:hypothetical protein